MADRISMEVAPGVKNLDPAALLEGIDIRDIQIGVEHGPTGQTYNRMAVPWAGAAYTLVDGSWTKIAGRPGSISGDEVENNYPNLADVWRQFAQAQQNRDSNPGSFTALVNDLRSVARSINNVGTQSPGEGTSLRAMKLAASGR